MLPGTMGLEERIDSGCLLLFGGRMLLTPLFFAIGMFWVVGDYMFHQVKIEQNYRKQYGDGWVAMYEKEKGPIKEVRIKMAIGVAGGIAVCVVGFYLIKMIRPEGRIRRSRRAKRRRT